MRKKKRSRLELKQKTRKHHKDMEAYPGNNKDPPLPNQHRKKEATGS